MKGWHKHGVCCEARWPKDDAQARSTLYAKRSRTRCAVRSARTSA